MDARRCRILQSTSRRSRHCRFRNRRNRLTSRRASEEETSLGSSDVDPLVSTRGRTASDTTAREVDHGISGQHCAAENCPRDPSNGIPTRNCNPALLRLLQTHSRVRTTPSQETPRRIARVYQMAMGMERLAWTHSVTRQIGQSLRLLHARAVQMAWQLMTVGNCCAPVVLAVACLVSFFSFSWFYFHFYVLRSLLSGSIIVRSRYRTCGVSECGRWSLWPGPVAVASRTRSLPWILAPSPG